MAIKTVTMSCPTEGARIYYTTDGSIPDQTKTLYTGAFQVDDTEIGVVQAVAYKEMMTWSDVAYEIVGLRKLETPVLTYIKKSTGEIRYFLSNASDYPINTVIIMNWQDLQESGTVTYTVTGNEGINSPTIFERTLTVPNELTVNCWAVFDNPLYITSDTYNKTLQFP